MKFLLCLYQNEMASVHETISNSPHMQNVATEDKESQCFSVARRCWQSYIEGLQTSKVT